ncbi:MAG: aromatic ring-hydroxylating dioxygenase subunit alpha [Xanthobacteraceae bacterium]
MLREYWYIAGQSGELAAGKPIARRLLGTDLVLWRDRNGGVNALQEYCAHRGAPLSRGRVQGDNIQCPFHGWTFDRSGRCVAIPSLPDDCPIPRRATVRAYPAREAGGYVWVYLGEKTDTLPPLPLPPEFDEPGWAIARRYHDVETDYTRLVEQNVDLVHFGFVHRGTFGRNMGPKDWEQWEVTSSPQGFRIKYGNDVPTWILNKRWNSRIGASDALMAGIHFEMPNVFRVVQSGMVLGLFSVPIERGRTRLYQYTARCWFTGVPVLSWLLSQLTLQLNRIILAEDMPILLRQKPNRIPDDPRAEVLIASDRAELLYRGLRANYFKAHPSESPIRPPHAAGADRDLASTRPRAQAAS